MNVLVFDSHFLHWVGCQKCSDLGHNGTGQTLQYDCVLDFQYTVEENDIDSGTKTLNNLDLEHRTFKLSLLIKLLWDPSLALNTQVGQEIGKTLTSDG